MKYVVYVVESFDSGIEFHRGVSCHDTIASAETWAMYESYPADLRRRVYIQEQRELPEDKLYEGG